MARKLEGKQQESMKERKPFNIEGYNTQPSITTTKKK
jgi:hypothetical protein